MWKTKGAFNYRISKYCFICNMYTRVAFVAELNQYINCRHYTPDVIRYLDVIDDNGYKIVTIADYVGKIEYWVWENGFKSLYTYSCDGFNKLSCGRGFYTVVVPGRPSRLAILTPRGVYEYKIPSELSIVSLNPFAISDHELVIASLSNLGFYLVLLNLETMESEIRKYSAQGFHYYTLSLADKILFGWYASPYYLVFDTKSREIRTDRVDTHFSVIDEFARLKMSLNIDFVGVISDTTITIGNGQGIHVFEYKDKLYYHFFGGKWTCCVCKNITITW